MARGKGSPNKAGNVGSRSLKSIPFHCPCDGSLKKMPVVRQNLTKGMRLGGKRGKG